MKTKPVPQASERPLPETTRPSFLTPEMIAQNPVLEAAGAFAGDPLWQELREEIKRNRERDRQTEEQAEK